MRREMGQQAGLGHRRYLSQVTTAGTRHARASSACRPARRLPVLRDTCDHAERAADPAYRRLRARLSLVAFTVYRGYLFTGAGGSTLAKAILTVTSRW